MLKKRIYALYKGDEILGVGTVEELAKMRGIKPTSLLFLHSPAYKKRRANSNRNILVLIRVEEDEE